MTRTIRKPLPSLRFVVYGVQTIELIPCTDEKGNVVPGYWELMGGGTRTTKQMSDTCKHHGFRHCIVGNDRQRRKEWM